MWKNIITQSALQIVVLGTILFKGTFFMIQDPSCSAFNPRSESRSGPLKAENITASSSTHLCWCRSLTRSMPGSSSLKKLTSSKTSSTIPYSSSFWPSPWLFKSPVSSSEDIPLEPCPSRSTSIYSAWDLGLFPYLWHLYSRSWSLLRCSVSSPSQANKLIEPKIITFQ